MEGIGESMSSKAEADPMVQRAGLLEMAGLYLGGADPRSPLAAPIYADLRGLAPLLIQVGAAETLLDDAIRLRRSPVRPMCASTCRFGPRWSMSGTSFIRSSRPACGRSKRAEPMCAA